MKNSKICVVGLGYIGLPTASIFATQGFDVLGVDVKPNVVETINNGEIHIDEPGLRTLVKAGVNSGQLRAALAPEKSDVFIIAVPTPCVEGDGSEFRTSDLSFVQEAMRAIMPFIEPGNLIILESTSPPSTTTRLVANPLEDAGYTIGQDIYVAHCPERVLPGHIMRELTQNDRVIGGVTAACAERAAALYRSFVEGQIHTTEATTAELVKLMENTFRDVNIALANELANICDHLGVNATEVIALANCHPRVNLHRPGPGVGGHCLPLDPWFVIESAPEQSALIRTARLLNQSVPRYLVQQVKQALATVENPKVAIFGVAYKGNVDDARETPAKYIIDGLSKGGEIDVAIYDPYVRNFAYELSGLQETVHDADALLICTGHDEFRFIDPTEIAKLMRRPAVFDLANHLDQKKWSAAGFEYVGRGSGTLDSEFDEDLVAVANGKQDESALPA